MKQILIVLIFWMPLEMVAQNIIRIDAKQAEELIALRDVNHSALIDGRKVEMFKKGHIKDAINIDAFEPNAEDELKPYLNKSQIIIYCTNFTRSEMLTEKLASLNYSGEIIFVQDGFVGWVNNGFDVEKDQPEINEIAPKTTDKEEPKGKPIIQVFGNFDFNATADVEKNYGFWFGRAHFGYEYQFSSTFSGKIILDMGRPTTLGQIVVNDPAGNPLDASSTGKDGSYYSMTLKFASLEWRPIRFLKIQAGGILQNHYITQEKFWGYRYLAETFQDRYYHIPSGDLGAIAYISLSEKVGFDVALTNGEGFRFDQDAFGDVKIASGIDYRPVDGLQTRIYWDYTSSDNPQKPAVQQLLSAFAGYRFGDKFRVAGEYNYRINHLNINDHDLYGYSLSGSYRFFEGAEVFARFDRLMANTLPGEPENWYALNTGKALITGVHYNPVKGINVSLNYQSWFPESEKSNKLHHVLLSFEYKL